MAKDKIPVEEGIFHIPESPDEKPCLTGAKCRECGYISFPRLMVCPRCMENNTMEEICLSGKGTIDMFSVCNAALPGFPAPSIQGYINLEEGVRIWSLITGIDPSSDDLKEGMEVELVIEKLKEDGDGNDIISYKFRPVSHSGSG